MVKIVGKEQTEIAREQRASKLVDILNENFGERFSETPLNPYTAQVYDKNIKSKHAFSIDFSDNQIKVSRSEYLGDAVRLAEIYEKSGEPEFTVKKNY